ncbi:MAG: hypothetical protein ACYDC9_13435, partial [Dermatophilaceae bacterium]
MDRIVAVTDHGTEVELFLSAVVPKFELRYAAAGLPTGKEPNRLIIEVQGPMPRSLIWSCCSWFDGVDSYGGWAEVAGAAGLAALL